MDNDACRHMNSVVYYSLCDTAINRPLIESGLLDVSGSPAIGLVVETACQCLTPIAFADEIDAGARIAGVGRSSVRCELGLFWEGDEAAVCAGRFKPATTP
jgi:acyl-CoA thioester hydrolase